MLADVADYRSMRMNVKGYREHEHEPQFGQPSGGSPGARRCAGACAARRGCCWPIAWAGGLALRGAEPDKAPAKVKAKSVIQIFLWGGMSHNDTWDPKPEAGREYMGEFAKAIPTNVDGIQLGELFPELAKQADKFSLIRSMTHRNNGHETAAYLMQTGHAPGERLAYPSVGAVFALFKRPELQGDDSALRGADAAAGAVLRRGLPGAEVQAVCHRRRPERAALRGGRRRRPRHHRRPAEGPPRAARQDEHDGQRDGGQSRSWRPRRRPRSRPTS